MMVISRAVHRFILQHRMLLLLLVISALLLSFAFIQHLYTGLTVIVEILFNLLLLAGVHLVNRNKQIVAVCFLTALLAIIVIWFDYWLHVSTLLLFGLLAECSFLAITAISIIRYVLDFKKISSDKIFGAINGYFLIAISWAMIFTIIELIQPNSFQFSHGFLVADQAQPPYRLYFSQFIYFSLVTISTLGYGDIVSISGPARYFASMEAVTGQLYVAVLIARLVGLHIINAQIKK